MALDDLGHILCTSVADLDSVLVKKLMQCMANREMLVLVFMENGGLNQMILRFLDLLRGTKFQCDR